MVGGEKEMWISKKRYEYLIRRIEKCERKLQTQKEENTLEIWNMAKKILEQPQRLSEEIRSTEKNDEFVEKFIRS